MKQVRTFEFDLSYEEYAYTRGQSVRELIDYLTKVDLELVHRNRVIGLGLEEKGPKIQVHLQVEILPEDDW